MKTARKRSNTEEKAIKPAMLISEIFPPRVGGSGRWLWEIYQRFSRESVLIAAGEAEGQEEFDRCHELRVTRLPLTLRNWGFASLQGLRGYWRPLRRLLTIVNRERIAAVHSGRCVPEGVLARLLKLATGTKYTCFVHGEEVNLALPVSEDSGVTADTDDGVLASREIRLLTRWVLRGAEFVIANSRNTQKILEEHWRLPANRIHLIHPGVDTEQFVPATRDSGLRRQLGWDDRPVVLTVGRLQRRKGHDQMIRALATIRELIPNVLYAIVGDGEQRQALEDLVAAENLGGHVQFLGRLDEDEMVRCYQQCDLFVLPNRAIGRDIEGFGLVLLEAQACGKPVVAGDSGGTAETMRIPETGLVVPCERVEELVSVITELLSDPDRLASMGVAARHWAVAHFDWDAVGQKAGKVLNMPMLEFANDGDRRDPLEGNVRAPSAC